MNLSMVTYLESLWVWFKPKNPVITFCARFHCMCCLLGLQWSRRLEQSRSTLAARKPQQGSFHRFLKPEPKLRGIWSNWSGVCFCYAGLKHCQRWLGVRSCLSSKYYIITWAQWNILPLPRNWGLKYNMYMSSWLLSWALRRCELILKGKEVFNRLGIEV